MTSGIDLEAAGKTTIKLLRCSVCTNFLIEPVFTCDEWHPTCGFCFYKLDRRTCGCSLRLDQNNCAKRLLRLIFPTLNCRNQIHGCLEMYPPANMLAHLEVCNFRNMKCPIQRQHCDKRTFSPIEAFAHLKMDHGIKEVNSVLEKSKTFVCVSHKIRISFDCVNTGIFEPPVYFTNTLNFLISYEIFNRILVWWVCKDDVADICKQFEYETIITTRENGYDNSMVTGKHLPVYGIRNLELRKLLRINGSFSTCSANALFVKKYKHQKFAEDDFVDVTITIKLSEV